MSTPIFEAVNAVRAAQDKKDAAYAVMESADNASDNAHSEYRAAEGALMDAEIQLMNAISVSRFQET